MQWMGRSAAAVGIVLAVSLGGCAFTVGGGSSRTVVRKSAGEELASWRRALDEGAITQDEYEQIKKAFLKR
jgi:hypothetical protein